MERISSPTLCDLQDSADSMLIRSSSVVDCTELDVRSPREGRGKALVIALALLPEDGLESKRSLGPSVR